jgi:ferredoxin
MSINLIEKYLSKFTPKHSDNVPWQLRLLGLMAVTKKIGGPLDSIRSKLVMKAIREGDKYYMITKANTIKINKSLEKKESCLPSDLLHHFIDEANYHARVKNCMCRVRMKCKNHPNDMGCLMLGEAVVHSAPSVVIHMTKEEAHQYAEDVRKNGLVHMMGRTWGDSAIITGRGATKNHHKLMMVCNCCNCCCGGRIYPNAGQDFKNLIQRMPGVDIKVNDNCTGCKTCVSTCMFDGIRYKNGKAYKTEDCTFCGRCADVCPEKAIEITFKEERLSDGIKHFTRLVDLK